MQLTSAQSAQLDSSDQRRRSDGSGPSRVRRADLPLDGSLCWLLSPSRVDAAATQRHQRFKRMRPFQQARLRQPASSLLILCPASRSRNFPRRPRHSSRVLMLAKSRRKELWIFAISARAVREDGSEPD